MAPTFPLLFDIIMAGTIISVLLTHHHSSASCTVPSLSHGASTVPSLRHSISFELIDETLLNVLADVIYFLADFDSRAIGS